MDTSTTCEERIQVIRDFHNGNVRRDDWRLLAAKVHSGGCPHCSQGMSMILGYPVSTLDVYTTTPTDRAART